VDWPNDWPIVLVRPEKEVGLSGTAEVQAFAALKAMSKALSARLCQITLLELLPAVMEHDFATASESLFEFGQLVGEYFSPAQGGTYSTPQVRNLVKYLRGQGVRGVGQTSWGPTAFVMCPNTNAAEQLIADLRSKEWGDAEMIVTQAKNTGANVTIQ
jgi:beta-RFAP synthase